jgi:hypothetical protein
MPARGAEWVVSPKRRPLLLRHAGVQKENAMSTSRIAAAGLCVFLAAGPARAGGDIVLEWN